MSDSSSKPLLKARRPVIFVDNSADLRDAVERLSTYEGEFALDAERASGFKYGQRAYLIQVARRNGEIFLIDPAAISANASPQPFETLSELLKSDTWILHAASQDLPCLAELGLHPSRLIDTELGSRIAGLPRVGLGAVVEHFLGLALAKEHSAVDWSKRPLDQSWLDYAALDVDVLHELSDCLLADLTEKQKLDWAKQEFAHLLNFKPKPEKIDRWRGTTGLHEVKNQQGLAVARSLWQAREALAQKLDVSPGRLIPDLSIAHVAKFTPTSRPELASTKQFAGRASRTYLDTWWAAIEEGKSSRDLPPLKLPSTGIPNHRNWPSKWPKAHARLTCVRYFLNELAQQIGVPIENIVSPEIVRQLCWIERDSVDELTIAAELRAFSIREWQVGLSAGLIADSINQSANFVAPAPEETETPPS
jgi:ribonuclease D